MKTFLTVVVPLLAPSAFYIFWAWYRTRNPDPDADPQDARSLSTALQGSPWLWLLLAGVILAITLIVGLNVWQPVDPREATYVPSTWEGGKVIPGRIDP